MTPLKTAIAVAAAALAAIPAAAAPLSTWYGEFRFEEPLGRIGGDTPQDGFAAYTTYRLSLGPQAGNTGCAVSVEGFQRYEQLLCTATPEMESVIIKFYKFRPGTAYDRYRSGERLFTMTRTEGGIVTTMRAMRPSSDRTPRTGRLFRRIG